MSQPVLPESADGRSELAENTIRGSTLILSGRGLSLGLNFVVQVVTVRYLSQFDYGVFAFAFGLSEYLVILVTLGMDSTLSRFASIYHERGDHPRLLGSILVASGSVLALGVSLTLLVLAARAPIESSLNINAASFYVLLTLILIAPLSAIDRVLDSAFATLGGAWTIFTRRHLLRPGFKLLAVLFAICVQGNLQLLALAHLLAGTVGVALYAIVLIQTLKRLGLFDRVRWRPLVTPCREMFRFGLPQLCSDLSWPLRASLVLILLQYFGGAMDVAKYCAVLALARLNDIVVAAFSCLYTSTAARLLARKDWAALDHFYWRTAAWTTVLSFPLFIVSFVFAEPVVTLLYGEQYRQSSPILALIALGLYLHATCGLNSRTLAAEGRIHVVLLADVVTLITSLLLYSWLISRYAALGAAIGTCLTLVIHAGCKQLCLLTASRVVRLHREYGKVYAYTVAATLLLMFVQRCCGLPLSAAITLSGFVWLGLLIVVRDTLDVENTFPELLRLPGMRRLLAKPAS